MPKNVPTPQIEEICSGMKSATIPISESIITVIITIIMRLKNFLLSNFETMGNIFETIISGLLKLFNKQYSWFLINSKPR